MSLSLAYNFMHVNLLNLYNLTIGTNDISCHSYIVFGITLSFLNRNNKKATSDYSCKQFAHNCTVDVSVSVYLHW